MAGVQGLMPSAQPPMEQPRKHDSKHQGDQQWNRVGTFPKNFQPDRIARVPSVTRHPMVMATMVMAPVVMATVIVLFVVVFLMTMSQRDGIGWIVKGVWTLGVRHRLVMPVPGMTVGSRCEQIERHMGKSPNKHARGQSNQTMQRLRRPALEKRRRSADQRHSKEQQGYSEGLSEHGLVKTRVDRGTASPCGGQRI